MMNCIQCDTQVRVGPIIGAPWWSSQSLSLSDIFLGWSGSGNPHMVSVVIEVLCSVENLSVLLFMYRFHSLHRLNFPKYYSSFFNQWPQQTTNSLPCYLLPPPLAYLLSRLSPLLQSIMNPAAWLVHLASLLVSTTPPLPSAQKIKLRTPTTYKTIHNSALSYITNLVSE